MKRFISLIFVLFFCSCSQTGEIGEKSNYKIALITGANRGIGFALTQKYLNEGFKVYATYRSEDKSVDLLNLRKNCPGLTLIKIDLLAKDYDKILQAAIGTEKLDIVILNAGHFPYLANKYPNLESKDWECAFKVNVIAPTLITAKLEQAGNLQAGSKAIFIASRRGDRKVNQEDNYSDRFGYCTSKAACISSACQLALSLKAKGIVVIAGHPGHVATEMTRNKGMDPKESAQSIFNFVKDLKPNDSGKFFDLITGAEFA